MNKTTRWMIAGVGLLASFVGVTCVFAYGHLGETHPFLSYLLAIIVWALTGAAVGYASLDADAASLKVAGDELKSNSNLKYWVLAFAIAGVIHASFAVLS